MTTSFCRQPYNRVIEFQPKRTILDRPGTYDDYLDWKRERLAQQK